MSVCTCTPRQKSSGRPSRRCEAHTGYEPKPIRQQRAAPVVTPELLAAVLAEIGRKGGSAKSERKARAARENGKKGGARARRRRVTEAEDEA